MKLQNVPQGINVPEVTSISRSGAVLWVLTRIFQEQLRVGHALEVLYARSPRCRHRFLVLLGLRVLLRD